MFSNMPESCSAFGCTNRRKKGGKVQFFSFPLKDQERLKAWVHAVRRENFTPTKYSRLCSEHFTPENYEVRPNIIVPYLKKDAVPSVFKGFPAHLQTVPLKDSCRERSEPVVLPKEMPGKVSETVLYSSTKRSVAAPPLPGSNRSVIESTLRNRIKLLTENLSTKDMEITSLKQLVEELKKQTS